MGQFNASDNVLNAVPNGSGSSTPPVQMNGVQSTPAYSNGALFAVGALGGTAKSFRIAVNANVTPSTPEAADLAVTSQSAEPTLGYLPGSPEISANGTSTGIVWLIDRNLDVLRAYDASSLSTELWNSAQRAGNADSLGTAVKSALPTVANGHVYVGTTNSVVVYGLH
jgi:hypothetical protein